MAIFIVNGSVINALTRADIPALRNQAVRVWDRTLGDWHPLCSATTNDLGRYRITYDSGQLKEWGNNRAANVSVSRRTG